jgi:hypothetical protein
MLQLADNLFVLLSTCQCMKNDYVTHFSPGSCCEYTCRDVFYCAHVCLKAAKWIKVVNTFAIDFFPPLPFYIFQVECFPQVVLQSPSNVCEMNFLWFDNMKDAGRFRERQQKGFTNWIVKKSSHKKRKRGSSGNYVTVGDFQIFLAC